MTEAAAFWITQAGQGEVRTERIGPPGRGEVLVRARFSGVSRGTESLVFRGLVPSSQYERMRCPFQDGDFPAPVKYGYASVGVIEAIGPEVAPDRLAERVFCLYPHQSHFTLPASSALSIPDTVPDRRAVLAANMETAVNALWDAAPVVGDQVAVVGAGTVGCLVAALAAKIPGVQVELIDIDPQRAATAAMLSLEFAVPTAARREADLVVHASGTEDGLSLSLSLAGFEATVLELSWFGTHQVAVPLGEDFHSKRLTIAASQVGHVAQSRRSRRTRQSRLALALRLLADARFDCLLTGESRLQELPATMTRLAAQRPGSLCHTVCYD